MNPTGTNAQNDPANPADPDPFGLAALLRPPPIDYQELANKLVDPVAQAVANQITNQVATRVANQVATQVVNQMNMQAAPQAGPAQAPQPSKKRGKRAERCEVIQRIVTKVMISGLAVEGVKDIGSDRQPGPDDVDADNEAPWEIDFDAGPEDPANQEVVDRWVREVIRHPDMATLVNEGKITADKCSHAYVRKLLIHSFDTARSNIKINQDETGALRERQEISKDNSKKAARRRDLCSKRHEAAKTRRWRGVPIPDSWFVPEYHSDSESNPMPNLSGMRNTITAAAYKAMRKGADYEMLTPGWRSDEVTRCFHSLDNKHWKDVGNQPQGTRYYHSSTRRYDMDNIPDNLPRCMLNDEAWNNIMDGAKRETVVQNPPGWDELMAPPEGEGSG
ncbi:hypothetical protein FRC10_007955 [Ceratobasidium sp. 414]|nr:hypothetical protein FRC10_007955 [Ceratobasidium sp. 414]